jgi:hypothetical protein
MQAAWASATCVRQYSRERAFEEIKLCANAQHRVSLHPIPVPLGVDFQSLLPQEFQLSLEGALEGAGLWLPPLLSKSAAFATHRWLGPPRDDVPDVVVAPRREEEDKEEEDASREEDEEEAEEKDDDDNDDDDDDDDDGDACAFEFVGGAAGYNFS